MKWADYCVTKLSLTVGGMINNVLLYKDLGESLDNEEIERKRDWLVQQVNNGKTFCSIKRNDNGRWDNIGNMSYDGNIFTWHIVPQNIARRKTFVSYYHKDDNKYRAKFENLFGDLIIGKSVEDGDIDSDISDEYIKQLIKKDYLKDTTVLVVLIGPNTKCRKHVDWEISGALSSRVGGNSGLIGILLPTHPDYGIGKKWSAENLPKRLAANIESGYAKLFDWTDDRVMLQCWIEDAFSMKSKTEKIVNSTISQMKRNTCE